MVQHTVQVVPVPFCTSHYVNDAMYFRKDEVLERLKMRKKRKNDAELYQTESPSSTTSFTSFKLLAVRALQNLKYDEEILVDDVNNYQFSS